MVLAGRRDVIDRLLAAHEAWFNVERDHSFAGRTFPGYAEFHSSASQYVLVKRAKLWEASSHEYLFFCDVPHLDGAAFEDLVGFMTGDALAKVELSPDHMSSYLTLVVVADSVSDDIPRRVRQARFRKNFMLGLKGWADLRVAVVDLDGGQVLVNSQGKPLKETLAANAFIEGAFVPAEGEGAVVAAVPVPAADGTPSGDASAARASRRQP